MSLLGSHVWTIQHDQIIFGSVNRLTFAEIGRQIGGLTKNHIRGRWLRLQEKFKAWEPAYKELYKTREAAIAAFLRQLHDNSSPEAPEVPDTDDEFTVRSDGDTQNLTVTHIDMASPEGALEEAL